MLYLRRSEFFDEGAPPVQIIRRDPQVPFPFHTHEFSELVIVLSGRGMHFTDHGDRSVTRGDVIIVDALAAHGYRSCLDLVLVNVLFDAGNIRLPAADLARLRDAAGLAGAVRGSGLRLSADQVGACTAIIEEIEQEAGKRTPGADTAVVGGLFRLIAYLVRCASPASPNGVDRSSGFARARHYIEHHLTRPLRIGALLEASAMTESTMLRMFRRTYGFSPLQYQLRLRVERACRLLASTQLSVTEIAGRTGFADSNYFSRQFRKVMHASPRAYRSATRTASIAPSKLQPAPVDPATGGPTLPGARADAAAIETHGTSSFAGAAHDYLALLERGYPTTATLKIVGDRYRLSGEQRSMLYRGVAPREIAAARAAKRATCVRGGSIAIDGYNVFLTVANYLVGRTVFLAADGFLRDAAELHGAASKTEALLRSAEHVCRFLARSGIERAIVYLDAPVSHSGEHAERVRSLMSAAGVRGEVRVVRSADHELKSGATDAVATSDSAVIDVCTAPVIDIAREVIEEVAGPEFLDLRKYLSGGKDDEQSTER